MPTNNLSSDIYGINGYINQIKKNFTEDVNEDTLMLGTFGYMGQVFSDMFQNTIVMASEFSNESIPTKAKFEKNIISHALGLGITDINANPAQMDVLLTFIEEDIINWAHARNSNGDELPWTFVLDKNNQIFFGNYEFHTDYDIIINKVEVVTSGTKKRFAYTAQYSQNDFDVGNPISDVINPYLAPPIKLNLDGTNVIMVNCTLHQVEKNTQYTKVLSDNDVSAKTITFTFDGQLASFSLNIDEAGSTYHMIPVYEGLNVDTGGELYFYYTYLNSNTIRIKFDRNSKIPVVNSSVQINLQTTQGNNGNFIFTGTDYPEFTFESERLNYNNIICQIRPVTGDCLYGTNKKTIDELKQIIPKESLSRGSITNLSDLQNYFNMLETAYSKMYFYKKRDNALERLYYSFLIMKNDLNIIPTNTVNIVVDASTFGKDDPNSKLILKQGQILVLKPGDTEATLYKDGDVLPDDNGQVYNGSFVYTMPYDFTISKDPLYGMYMLSTIHANKILDFTFINESCLYQYIATSISWNRNYVLNHNTYKLSIDVAQNIILGDVEADNQPIYYDDNKNLVCNVFAYMIIYNKENQPLRWAKANMTAYDPITNIISYDFSFTTKDNIDNSNRIRIDTGLYDIGTTTESYTHLNSNMNAKIFIVSKQESSYGLGTPSLDTLIPGLTGLSLSNTYTVLNGLDFFYDYSGIVSSTVSVKENPDKTISYHIKDVPVVKYGYFDNEETAKTFFNELVTRKAYIDQAVRYLEDAFEMDFKFFNTYGPSKFFTYDNNLDKVDKVNLSLFFRLKLKPNYDSNIVDSIKRDVKDYIEDINNITDLHIPNLITTITNTYRDSIVFFEFVSINGKDASYQHLYSMGMGNTVDIPEFLNVNTLADGLPDIIISLV